MPAITLTITIDVPEGVDSRSPTPTEAATATTVPVNVLERVRRLVPTRYREFVERYLERCVSELGCSIEFPSGKRTDYVSVFPPPHCKRVRVSSVNYSTSRTGVFAGHIELDRYKPRRRPTTTRSTSTRSWRTLTRVRQSRRQSP